MLHSAEAAWSEANAVLGFVAHDPPAKPGIDLRMCWEPGKIGFGTDGFVAPDNYWFTDFKRSRSIIA